MSRRLLDGVGRRLEHVASANRLAVTLSFKRDWRAACEAFIAEVADTLDYRIRCYSELNEHTWRQAQVFRLYVADWGRDEIAARFGISEETVNAHLREVLKKSTETRIEWLAKRLRRGDPCYGPQ